MYKAIEYFTDLHDGEFAYNIGDEYPRKGYIPTAERIAELSGNANRRGRPVIEEVKEEKPEAAAKTEEKTAEGEKTTEKTAKSKRTTKKK